MILFFVCAAPCINFVTGYREGAWLDGFLVQCLLMFLLGDKIYGGHLLREDSRPHLESLRPVGSREGAVGSLTVKLPQGPS